MNEREGDREGKSEGREREKHKLWSGGRGESGRKINVKDRKKSESKGNRRETKQRL